MCAGLGGSNKNSPWTLKTSTAEDGLLANDATTSQNNRVIMCNAFLLWVNVHCIQLSLCLQLEMEPVCHFCTCMACIHHSRQPGTTVGPSSEIDYFLFLTVLDWIPIAEIDMSFFCKFHQRFWHHLLHDGIYADKYVHGDNLADTQCTWGGGRREVLQGCLLPCQFPQASIMEENARQFRTFDQSAHKYD